MNDHTARARHARTTVCGIRQMPNKQCGLVRPLTPATTGKHRATPGTVLGAKHLTKVGAVTPKKATEDDVGEASVEGTEYPGQIGALPLVGGKV
jgi:hypothetical protein